MPRGPVDPVRATGTRAPPAPGRTTRLSSRSICYATAARLARGHRERRRHSRDQQLFPQIAALVSAYRTTRRYRAAAQQTNVDETSLLEAAEQIAAE